MNVCTTSDVTRFVTSCLRYIISNGQGNFRSSMPALDFQVPWNCVHNNIQLDLHYWRFMRRRNIIKYHTTNCHICLNLRIQNLLSTLYYVHSRVYYVKNKDVQTWDIFYLCVDLVCVFVFVWGYQAIRGLNFFFKVNIITTKIDNTL